MADTIFQKIINKSVPSHIIYEDAQVIAFLDVAPLSLGHVLLVPKEPAQTLDVLSEDAAAALGRVLPRLCRAVMHATGTDAYNIVQNNRPQAHQAVMHVHFHIIPKPNPTQGLNMAWKPLEVSEIERMQMATKIKAHITKP